MKRRRGEQRTARRPADRSTTTIILPPGDPAWEVEEGEEVAATALAVAIAATMAAAATAPPAPRASTVTGPSTETATIGTTTIAATAIAPAAVPTTTISTSVKRPPAPVVVEASAPPPVEASAPAPVDEQADLSPAELIARPAGPAGQAPAAPAQEEATPEEVLAIAGALPAAARAAAQASALANAALGWWKERLVQPVSSLVGRMLNAPGPAARGARRHEPRRLPFELHLCMAAGSVRVAPAGPIDDLACFQRAAVSAHHDVEYLVRLDPQDAGTERFEAFGLFRLREAEASPLADLRDLSHVWEALARDLELSALPRCRPLLRDAGRPPGAQAEEAASWLRVVAGGRPFQTVKGRRVTLAEVIDWLRAELAPAEKIAWMEEAFTTPPEPGQIIHRYYLDARRKAWLVRHHWGRGKLLFAARTSAEAKRLCELESANFTRSGAARRASGSAPRPGASSAGRRPGKSGITRRGA